MNDKLVGKLPQRLSEAPITGWAKGVPYVFDPITGALWKVDSEDSTQAEVALGKDNA